MEPYFFAWYRFKRHVTAKNSGLSFTGDILEMSLFVAIHQFVFTTNELAKLLARQIRKHKIMPPKFMCRLSFFQNNFPTTYYMAIKIRTFCAKLESTGSDFFKET